MLGGGIKGLQLYYYVRNTGTGFDIQGGKTLWNSFIRLIKFLERQLVSYHRKSENGQEE
ncbi:MAG: hypothetical protein ACI8Z7_000301 [Candidatus Nanohaloarchaea archaeon]|jgi:hypothetical protein